MAQKLATKYLQQYNIGVPRLYRIVNAMTRLTGFVWLCLVLFQGGSAYAQSQAPKAQDAGIELVASIRPLALIALAVGDNRAHVHQLVPNGASSHDYQLRPSDRLALSSARIILWTGPAHERFLQKTLSGELFGREAIHQKGSGKNDPLLIELQSLPGIHLRPQRSLDGSVILPGTVDPHLWLDVDNAAVVAVALAEALASRDPSQAKFYRANAAAFSARMAAFKSKNLNRFWHMSSASRGVVAYHDAYQYLEPALGLLYRGSLTAHEASGVGAKHFLLMSQRIQTDGLKCLLAEPGFSEALAQRAFAGRVGKFTVIDEFFTTVSFDAKGYESGITQMSDAIYTCLIGK